MCGIAGILSHDTSKVSRQRLQAMTTAIAHRGPQGEGFWVNENNTVGFGHRRLSIIDLSNAGAQPMHFKDRYTIVHNGEIYNYIELKNELINKGYHFASHTDTEVVLAAYDCYGKDCLQHFDGMFAFAIWDAVEHTLFCARDRFGEKPFYYHYNATNNELVFASEMKALWAAGVPKKMRSDMLFNYLTLGWVQSAVSKEATFYEDIFSLPPAHCITYHFPPDNKATFTISSYWDLDKETKVQGQTDKQLQSTFMDLLTTSVSRRLRSDVPVGSSLSGGLDSSSIVAIINQMIGDATKQKTFSAVFPGFEKDESAYIKQVVERFGVDNFTTTPTSEDFIQDFQTLIHHQEEPFQSASIYAQYKVYQLAKQQGVTVILDGQGADETLAGYTKYYHWYWQELIAAKKWNAAKVEKNNAAQNGQKIDWGFKNYLAAFLPQVAANQLEKKTYHQQLHNNELTKDFIDHNKKRSNIYKPAIATLNDVLYFNTMQFGLEELLRYADRNAMAHGREVRLPFLSHQLVEFVFSLPAQHKIRNGFTKYLLRQSIDKLLPQSIVWRKDKVGFEPPQKTWMQHPAVTEYTHESRKKLVKEGILQPSVLQKPIRFQAAHEAANFDWWYLCAAQCL